MALTLYTDTYAEPAFVDQQMHRFKTWLAKTAPEKEARIKAVSFSIDDYAFWGIKKVQAQPMKFPRSFGAFEGIDYFEESDNILTEDEQTRRLRKCVIAQLIFEENDTGLGNIQHSIGDESFTPRQAIMCAEARAWIEDYIKL